MRCKFCNSEIELGICPISDDLTPCEMVSERPVVWYTTLVYDEKGKKVEIWSDGPATALGAVQDAMDKLKEGDLTEIKLDRRPAPDTYRPVNQEVRA